MYELALEEGVGALEEAGAAVEDGAGLEALAAFRGFFNNPLFPFSLRHFKHNRDITTHWFNNTPQQLQQSPEKLVAIDNQIQVAHKAQPDRESQNSTQTVWATTDIVYPNLKPQIQL